MAEGYRHAHPYFGGLAGVPPPASVGFRSWFPFFLGLGGDPGTGGSTVVFFRGVSTADGVTNHQGVSKPTIVLTDAGGGTYTVTKTHKPEGNFKADSVSKETYLIDGVLP